ELQLPNVPHPTPYTLSGDLGAGVPVNQYELWIFPARDSATELGENVAATDSLRQKLQPRYPRLQSIEQGAAAAVVLSEDLNEPAIAALRAGKSVLCLGLARFRPVRVGPKLGWWNLSSQRGTA